LPENHEAEVFGDIGKVWQLRTNWMGFSCQC